MRVRQLSLMKILILVFFWEIRVPKDRATLKMSPKSLGALEVELVYVDPGKLLQQPDGGRTLTRYQCEHWLWSIGGVHCFTRSVLRNCIWNG